MAVDGPAVIAKPQDLPAVLAENLEYFG